MNKEYISKEIKKIKIKNTKKFDTFMDSNKVTFYNVFSKEFHSYLVAYHSGNFFCLKNPETKIFSISVQDKEAEVIFFISGTLEAETFIVKNNMLIKRE